MKPKTKASTRRTKMAKAIANMLFADADRLQLKFGDIPNETCGYCLSTSYINPDCPTHGKFYWEHQFRGCADREGEQAEIHDRSWSTCEAGSTPAPLSPIS